MAPDMIFTSESVTPGHPDKLCDQISDAAIDAFLRQDPGAHAVVECAVATGVVFLAARFAADATVDLPSLARKVIADAGYLEGRFDARNCSILTSLVELPATMREPSSGDLDEASIESRVAQDQANVFGYACKETAELMPLPVSLAHRLARALDAARADDAWLLPDGKTQVSVEYRDSRAARIHSISLNAAVAIGAPSATVEERLRALAVETFRDDEPRPDARTAIHINAGGPYETGGPARHAGLTGRKNGIDTYGEIARQSGAALSGKDPSRIDRIGAYAARHAAKNVIAAGLADRCEVHLAYAIGSARPLSLSVETFGTGLRLADAVIAERIAALLDFRPAAIARRFALRTRPASANERGFYRPLAVYGHFGRADLDLPWEATDVADALRD